ncbi:MAG: hypothetical protein J0H17_10425 [Rhizobiales bacterium]|nr:hypothetical protein [Hyphomicrobiales bacterium]
MTTTMPRAAVQAALQSVPTRRAIVAGVAAASALLPPLAAAQDGPHPDAALLELCRQLCEARAQWVAASAVTDSLEAQAEALYPDLENLPVLIEPLDVLLFASRMEARGWNDLEAGIPWRTLQVTLLQNKPFTVRVVDYDTGKAVIVPVPQAQARADELARIRDRITERCAEIDRQTGLPEAEKIREAAYLQTRELLARVLGTKATTFVRSRIRNGVTKATGRKIAGQG